MHTSAERLFPILVECDAEVGVVQSKIYDAKLVLSLFAKRSVAEKLTFDDHTPATYAAFGLAEPGRGGMSLVENRELVREPIYIYIYLFIL